VPPAAPPGDRAKMEAALGAEVCRTLRQICRAAGIPPDAWHKVPALARVFETVAVVRLAETVGGEAGKDARAAAAVSLGLCPDTQESRLRRWLLDAYNLAS